VSETDPKPAAKPAKMTAKPGKNETGKADATSRLARRLAAARRRAGLTQAELAEASGVTDETISRIERGRYEPAVSTFFRLADALDVSLDQLARDSERDRDRADRATARRPPGVPSPIVRRLRARIDALTPTAQRALLAIAEELPEAAKKSGSNA
jgi:transcriptional regulator with XRE-family HTH domain